MDSLKRWRNLFGKSGSLGSIGLELSLHQLHMVQLRRTGDDLSVQAYTSVDYEELPQERDALKVCIDTALANADFRGKTVVAAMPQSQVQVMPVSYQVRSGESGDAAIAALMSERLGEDVGDLIIDYMPVQTLALERANGHNKKSDTNRDGDSGRPGSRERLALVAVCRRESVLKFVDNLNYAGLDVVAVEIGPIAIRRLVAMMLKNLPPQNTLVLNCGRDKSYLTVIADERLLADDCIDVGESDFIDAVAKQLELPDELAARLVSTTNLDPNAAQSAERKNAESGFDESARMLTEILKPLFRRLVHETDRGLVYAGSESRGVRGSQIYLLGSLARWNGADALLESMLNVPVSTIPSPVSLFGVGGGEASPELAVATGLALKPERTNA